GFSLLNCPAIGRDITLCQSLGKKVLLTIDGLVENDVNSPRYAVTVATNVWNVFLGGSSSVRPFGSAVLDGIDLHIWNNDKVGVDLFVRTLRNL
ncbi:glycoside hydrolase superfamily, partial [Chytridium lagenaria]